MALVTCPECKGDVSTSANSCPHCGFSSPKYLLFRIILLINGLIFSVGTWYIISDDKIKLPRNGQLRSFFMVVLFPAIFAIGSVIGSFGKSSELENFLRGGNSDREPAKDRIQIAIRVFVVLLCLFMWSWSLIDANYDIGYAGIASTSILSAYCLVVYFRNKAE